jgi:hypothetical protein
MKFFNYVINILFIIILSTVISAYPVSLRMESEQGSFTTDVYRCTSSSCDNLAEFVTSTTGINQIVTIPSTYSGTNYFAFYTYKDGFVPHTYRVVTHASTTVGPWPFNINFNKNNNCYSNIVSMNFNPIEVDINDEVIVNANIQSVFIYNDHVKTIPSILNEVYSTNIDVSFYVNDIFMESEQISIPWNEFEDISFSYFPNSLGLYNLEIRTDAVSSESQCSDGIEMQSTRAFNIIDLIQPSIIIHSPENRIYDNTEILVNISVEDNVAVDSVWYNWNGTNVTYNNEHFVKFNEGSNILYAWVNDTSGNINSASVIFNIELPSLNITSLNCFDHVVVNNNQSCSVYVESDGASASDVNVSLYYAHDDSFFGSCLTDSLSGGCSVKDLQLFVGDFMVYGVADKLNYSSDNDRSLNYSYTVYDERYDIHDLKVYNDSSFVNEDYDFFRGEDMYVQFSVI